MAGAGRHRRGGTRVAQRRGAVEAAPRGEVPGEPAVGCRYLVPRAWLGRVPARTLLHWGAAPARAATSSLLRLTVSPSRGRAISLISNGSSGPPKEIAR